jgi:hypothetical protein
MKKNALIPVIIPERRALQIPGRERKLYLSNQELISHGCKNCIWRLHKQCKHGVVTADEFYEFDENIELKSGQKGPAIIHYSGYCQEYIDFILGFAEENDSISAIWEKFALYVGRIQSLDDYKRYIEMQDRIALLEQDGASNRTINNLETKKDILRILWERMNDAVRKGYARIADREARSKDSKSNVPGIMNAKVINFNMNKEIEQKE